MTPPTTCIVLAGGLGTRLSGVLGSLPKCLAPVGDRFFLELQLDELAAQGIERFVLSLGHAADMVLARVPRLQRRHDLRVIVETAPLGTGGAMLLAMHECALDECLITNGDTLLNGNLTSMFAPLDRLDGEEVRMASVQVTDRGRYGGLKLEGVRVTGFVEKGSGSPGPINAGLYRVTLAAFDGRTSGTAFSFEQDVMPGLVEDGVVRAAPIGGDFIDIGVPEDYARFLGRYTPTA